MEQGSSRRSDPPTSWRRKMKKGWVSFAASVEEGWTDTKAYILGMVQILTSSITYIHSQPSIRPSIFRLFYTCMLIINTVIRRTTRTIYRIQSFRCKHIDAKSSKHACMQHACSSNGPSQLYWQFRLRDVNFFGWRLVIFFGCRWGKRGPGLRRKRAKRICRRPRRRWKQLTQPRTRRNKSSCRAPPSNFKTAFLECWETYLHH